MDGSELVGESAAGMAEALPDGGALIGLDLGTRTIGIAVCDAGCAAGDACTACLNLEDRRAYCDSRFRHAGRQH